MAQQLDAEFNDLPSASASASTATSSSSASATTTTASAPNPWAEVAQGAIADLLASIDPANDSKWQYVDDNNNVKIYKQDVVGVQMPKVKGVGVIDWSASAILNLIWDLNRKKEYDKLFKSGRVVLPIDARTHIVYQEFERQWPTSPRDFLNLATFTIKDGCYIIAARSVTLKDHPADNDHVRGDIMGGGFFIKPLSTTSCHVTFVAHADLKGSLPSGVTKMVSMKQPLVIDGIRLALKASKASNDIPFTMEDGTVITASGVSASSKDVPPSPTSTSSASTSSSASSSSSPSSSAASQSSVSPSSTTAPVSPSASAPAVSAADDGKSTDTKTGGIPASLLNTYHDIGEKAVNILIKEGNKDGWVFSHEEKDIHVFVKKDIPATECCVKGVGVINASAYDLLQLLSDPNKRKWYDDMVDNVSVVEDVDGNTSVLWQSYKTEQACKLSPRDFSTLCYSKRLANGSYVMVARSVDHDKCPPKQGFTRSDVFIAGWIIKPSNQSPNRSLVTYVLHCDLKEKLSKSVLTTVAKKQPLILETIRNMFA